MSRVAVIGAGFGGLTAAGELARAGHRVTIFEQASSVGGKAQVVTSGGHTFDTGPTLLTMPNVVQETFARLGAKNRIPEFHRLVLQARYTWNDGTTFEAHEELEPTVASAEALQAGEGQAFRRFAKDAERIFEAAGVAYLEAPLEGFPEYLARVARKGASKLIAGLQMSTLDAVARKHFDAPQLQQFVNRFATYVGASPYEASGALSMIPHLERSLGVFHVQGGMGALVRALAEAVVALGVDVRVGCRATWEKRGNELIVGPAGGEETFDALVVNADPMGEQKLESSKLAMSGYVALMDVAQRLPLAHHHVHFAPDYRQEFSEIFSGQIPSEPTIYFCHAAATDPLASPAGRSGVFAMVNAPAFRSAEEADRWSEWGPRLRERCIDALCRVVPGLSRSAVSVVAERTPLELARLGAPGGSIYGFLPHGTFAPFQRPKARSKVPGVFYAGGSVHPGGGVPMVMLSGHFAAQLVQERFAARRAA
jgi:phytoene desaturase